MVEGSDDEIEYDGPNIRFVAEYLFRRMERDRNKWTSLKMQGNADRMRNFSQASTTRPNGGLGPTPRYGAQGCRGGFV